MFGNAGTRHPRLYLAVSTLQDFAVEIVLQATIAVRCLYLDQSPNVLSAAVVIMISAMAVQRILIFNDLYRLAQNDSIINSCTEPDIREKIWLQGAIDAYNLFFDKHEALDNKFLFFYHHVILCILFLQILLQI